MAEDPAAFDSVLRKYWGVFETPLNQEVSECTIVLAHVDKNIRINSRLQEFSSSALIAWNCSSLLGHLLSEDLIELARD